MTKPMSRETQAILAAIDDYESPRVTVAQAFRALAFLASAPMPMDRGQLLAIATELEGDNA